MSIREEQCKKVCRILDDVLANRPTERDSLIVAVRKAFAEPKRLRGKWVFKNDLVAIPTGYYECSECKIGRLMHKENFCPNCGADMRGVIT